jgi:hypothetical protein
MYLVNNDVDPTQMVDINANGTNTLFHSLISQFLPRLELSPSIPFSPTGTFLLKKLLMTELITKFNSTASVISRPQECLLNLENSPLSTVDQNQVPKPVQSQKHPPADQPPPPAPLVAPTLKTFLILGGNSPTGSSGATGTNAAASATGSGSSSTSTGKSSGHATYGSRGFAIALGMIGVGFAAMFVTA